MYCDDKIYENNWDYLLIIILIKIIFNNISGKQEVI